MNVALKVDFDASFALVSLAEVTPMTLMIETAGIHVALVVRLHEQS